MFDGQVDNVAVNAKPPSLCVETLAGIQDAIVCDGSRRLMMRDISSHRWEQMRLSDSQCDGKCDQIKPPGTVAAGKRRIAKKRSAAGERCCQKQKPRRLHAA